MIILGLNAYHADSSACLMIDGKIVAASEEERFTRIKHWAGFPSKAIQFCLDVAGITFNDLDAITIGRDTSAKRVNKIKYLVSNPKNGLKILKKRYENKEEVDSLAQEFEKHFKVDKKIIEDKIKNIEHHRSHCGCSFYPSPFDDAAILSIDGSGDFTTTMIAHGKGNEIKILDSVDFPISIGFFYTAFTHLLGFPNYGDEYKVMGLAPYGQPDKVNEVKSIFKESGHKLLEWERDYFNEIIVNYEDNAVIVPPFTSRKFHNKFGGIRDKNTPLTQEHKNMAASVQKATEEMIFELAKKAQKLTESKNLCITGGVAQNSVANGKLLANTNFEKVYAPSAGHDAGISMGSALYYYHNDLKNKDRQRMTHAYLGKSYLKDEIESFLEDNNIEYKHFNNEQLIDYVADGLVKGKVIGWFQGSAEFGPRALGNRSIIVDPRRSDAKELLNEKIKRRESFRPFAPSILEEYVEEYFDGADQVPFMEKVYPIKKEKQETIPAVTHVDGTGRLQTVIKSTNPRYHALISKFYEKTGVPIILNTSFNENEPIVNSPKEAYDCFSRTKMDMLVLGDFILER